VLLTFRETKRQKCPSLVRGLMENSDAGAEEKSCTPPTPPGSRHSPTHESPQQGALVMKRLGISLTMALSMLLAPAAFAGKDGKCGFDSDCGTGVKCHSGRCANTAGSSCGFDSDCGGGGAKCRSGKCSTAPDGTCAFNSECPGGSCSSGKCKK
jgi:hypothetical protein